MPTGHNANESEFILILLLWSERYQSFPYTTPGALFRKLMLLDTDFLNSDPGLHTENFGNFVKVVHIIFIVPHGTKNGETCGLKHRKTPLQLQ